MPSLCDHSLSTWVLSLLLGSYCLVASTGYGLGIIYNHDDNNDDVTSCFIHVQALSDVNHKIICLIGTWRTTQENSATTILYGSGLG
jgi:hypothetical protein